MNALELVRRVKRSAPRGQAMIEYSVVAHFLLIGGTVMLLPVITRMFEALNAYYDSMYAIIQTAAI